MTTVLERLPPGARVAVIRLRSLGDCVLTTPALHLLKNARPDLDIAVVVENAFAPLFDGNPDVYRTLPPDVAELVRWGPQLVLNLHGGTKSAQLTMASRAPLRAGFAHFRFRALYNIRIPRAQQIFGIERKVHTAEHLASAVFYLGVPRQEIPRSRLFSAPPGAAPPYAVLHPFASAPEKTWPAANFLELAAHLVQKARLAPIFIAGPGESLAEFSSFRCLAGAPLSEVQALISKAALFIGNDSGPAHIAAAFGVPVVVLFGASDHATWGPWKTEASVLAERDIREITVDRVIGALAGLPA